MVSCHEATQDDLSRSVGDKEPHGRAHAPTSIMSAPAANSLTPSGGILERLHVPAAMTVRQSHRSTISGGKRKV